MEIKRAHSRKDLKAISLCTDILAKVYWQFEHLHLRAGVWDDLFSSYIGKQPKGNGDTNFKRRLWEPKSNYTWEAFCIGVLILRERYPTIAVRFELVLPNGNIEVYAIDFSELTLDKVVGKNIKGRVSDTLLMHETNLPEASSLAVVLRRIFINHKLTFRDLDGLLSKFVGDIRNIYSFEGRNDPKKLSSIKCSIRNTILKSDVQWTNFLRALMVLDYDALSVELFVPDIQDSSDTRPRVFSKTSLNLRG